MATNEYLHAAIDLATQAKFTFFYQDTPGYTNGDTLYELFDHFGIIITQASSGVTLNLPTSGLGVSSRHYFRQVTSRYGSAYSVTLNLDGTNTVVLNPGDTCYLFWTGSLWMAFPGASHTSIQGRIETPVAKSYLAVRGTRQVMYLNKIYLNVDSGSGDVNVTKDGLVLTTAAIGISPGTESQYTFSPKVMVETSSNIGLSFANVAGLEGVHYRLDLDSAS
jgi:hypothetical protein